MTGNPYALYARVRGISAKGQRRPLERAVRLQHALARPAEAARSAVPRPGPLDADRGRDHVRGLARRLRRRAFFTTTNVADQREFYAFHAQPWWIQAVNWRIRAVRKIYGDIPTGMPRVTYGAWSDWFTNINPPFNVSFNAAVQPDPG